MSVYQATAATKSAYMEIFVVCGASAALYAYVYAKGGTTYCLQLVGSSYTERDIP